MNKRFTKSSIGLLTAVAVGGSYQLFAQSSSSSTAQTSSSPAVIVPSESSRPSVSRAVGGGLSSNAVTSEYRTADGRTVWATTVNGQQPAWLQPNQNRLHEAITIEDGKVKIVTSDEPISPETRAESVEVQKRIEEAHRTFRSDNVSESDKTKAKSLLESYLTAQFDHDQEMRRKQIKSLEEEIAKLKKQITKREDSRDKLVELRMTLLENDANGLGFPPAFNNIPGAASGANVSGFGSYNAPYSGNYPVYPANTIQGSLPTVLPPGVPPGVPPQPFQLLPNYDQNRSSEPSPAKRGK